MLTTLNIQHFVLIDQLSLTFDKGFSVFTGETGAGKSILLDALTLILGGRAEARFVAKDAQQAVISAGFSLPAKHPAWHILDEQGLAHDDELIIRRTLTKDGKSKCFVCDQPVSVGLLKTLGETLVEIHGQFATHSLLNPSTHAHTLDAYGQLESVVKKTNTLWHTWQEKQKSVQDFEEKLAQQLADEDFMRESLEELEQLNPKADEEEKLTQKRTQLMNAERIIENVKNAWLLLSDEEQGILRLINRADGQLLSADKITNGSFNGEIQTLAEAQNLMADLSNQLEYKLNDLGDTSELPEIDERLFQLRDLARKHHTSIAELPQLKEQLAKDLKVLNHSEEELIKLKRSCEQARLDYLAGARDLSTQRHQVAQKLNQAVMQELPDLKLEKATFEVQVQDLDESQSSPNGLNQITFMVATNKGSALTPIHKCASGGELARFMLALKVNLADKTNTTLIFDEIDTGISGGTANAVGERLARLAEHHQTLVITHSPQVAGQGKHHYLVQKSDTDNATVTSVQKLDKTGRLEELARLVSGAKITDKSRELAHELLKH